MLSDKPSAIQLSQVIAQVTAPSFLLGAVAAFISLLIARMNRIIDRSQALNAISDDDALGLALRATFPARKGRRLREMLGMLGAGGACNDVVIRSPLRSH